MAYAILRNLLMGINLPVFTYDKGTERSSIANWMLLLGVCIA